MSLYSVKVSLKLRAGVAQRPIFAATLLCTLDRIFDDVTAFKLRGKSFRGKKLEIGFSANRKAICN